MSDDKKGVGSEEGPKKKSKGLLIVLILSVLLGGGAFYGVYSGMIPSPFGNDSPPGAVAEDAPDAFSGDVPEPFAEERPSIDPASIAFIALDDMIISLGSTASASHLKVKLSIEVAREEENAVSALKPRILDVLNTFLRAVDERELEKPHAMMRIRAQMLRRVQLVTPEGAVRDVLIQEFVLN